MFEIFLKMLVAILPLYFLSNLFAGDQQLYMPLDIQKSYMNGTRSIDGNPGPRYWQNSSTYMIQVTLDPTSRLITGAARILYSNQSPDTLSQIVIRLYQDILRKGNIRDVPVNPADLIDGVGISKLSVGDENFKPGFDEKNAWRTGTNLIIRPEKKVLPGSISDIKIEWNFTVPKMTAIRMGTYDSTSFLIAYWYPQVAVYDDINGWDIYNYTGHQEFYNDQNNYDVEIVVPKNFIVWSTGQVQNASEVLSKRFLKRYNQGLISDTVFHIIREKDLGSGLITTNKDWQTWKFKASGVPDFVFATSDHYLWDMTSLVVDQQTGRRISIDAAYKVESEDFYDVAYIAKKSIAYFSTQLPGVPYPYPKMTIFNGSGGMEYPMMVNDGSTAHISSTISLTSHEIAHSYFPFFMGTNEKKYAWMDEGWAVMLPFDFVSSMTNKLDRRAVVTTQYNFLAGKELDIPIMVSSIVYGSNAYRPSYRGASYTRSSIAYNMLRELLGDDLFKKALHGYMSRWNGKHPIPYDFFFTFDNIIGENLSWFWKPWFFDYGYPDLAIAGINAFEKKLEIIIESRGNIPVPVNLKVIYTDDTEIELIESSKIWSDGKRQFKLGIDKTKQIKRLELGSPYIPDVDLKNNTWSFN